MYVHQINTVLTVLFAVVVTACGARQYDNTAVLSKQTRSIIDYFLDETENQYTDENLLEIHGTIKEDGNYILEIYAVDSTITKPYGKYNGRVRYKKYDILLFGDYRNDFFWKCATTYDIPYMPSDDWGLVYDPLGWTVCIRCKDTTIIETNSEFPYFLSCPVSHKEYSRAISDSLQKIIHK